MSDSAYSDAFKKHALTLLQYSGQSIDEVAMSLNLSAETLSDWQSSVDLFADMPTSEKETLLGGITLFHQNIDVQETIAPPTTEEVATKDTLMLGLSPSVFSPQIETTAPHLVTAVSPSNGSTILQTWMGVDQVQTLLSPSVEDWKVPSYEHPFPLLSRGYLLGEGGMGRVMTGTQASTGREVAVKEVRPDRSSKSIVRRLLQEAWITGLLEHPNIVPIYTIEKNEHNQPMILMKKITGQTWKSYIEDPDLIPTEEEDLARLQWHLKIFDDVCSAMHYAHDKGIIHRDLKPDNVMLGTYNEVYVLDWGIAVAVDERYQSWIPTANKVSGTAGTPAYIAPEMVKESGIGNGVSLQSDIYLLGAILFEILEGHAPHSHVALANLAEHCRTYIPHFSESTPHRLQQIIRKAMAIEPTDRYSHVSELQNDIQTVQRFLDVQKIIVGVRREMDKFDREIAKERPNRASIYSHFVATRFGLQQVSDAFLSPKDYARFQNLIVAICEWEVKCERPDAAELLLADLKEPPPELVSKIKSKQDLFHKEQERLRKMDIDQSDTIGIRTRAGVIILTIIGWLSFPLWSAVTQIEYNYGHLFMQSVGMLSWMLIIGFWAKDSLSATEVNRRTFSILLGEPIFHTVADLCAWTLDWTAQEAWLLRFIVWSTMLLSYAMLMEFRFFPIAFAYSLMTIVLFVYQDWADLVSIGLNVSLLLSMGFVWRKELDEAKDARELKLKERARKRNAKGNPPTDNRVV